MEQVLNKQQTSMETTTGTSTEQALVSSINNTNISNKTNISKFENGGEQTQNFEKDNLGSKEKKEKEKSCAKKEKDFYVTSSAVEKPTIETVKAYFLEQKFPELEANKFFNYFSSIGWLVGGKTPMIDWQAAAKNWMLNSINFNHNTITTPIQHRQNANTATDKNYSEPL